ncbi:MAG: HupE/UreJ family protein [Acidobacteria bacterium]|nr:HupE/UreJ family protein [Acidobacteriota bacterium]
MTGRVLGLLAAMPLAAHVISMSTGDLKVTGNRAAYHLRMPLYELQHVRSPEKTLLENIRFSSGGAAARTLEWRCAEDMQDASYKCNALYEWPQPVEQLEVVCKFHSITVPNHVHLLRAYREDKSDQAVFDFSNTKSEIRFRPPAALELFVTAAGSGFARAFSSAAAVLFLGCLTLAARSRKELLGMAAMFLLGEALSALVVPRTAWNPAPRFVEAALALTVAYLAVEILMLPEAGQRWLVAGVLGGFHGLSYALYITSTGYDAFFVLLGLGLADVLAVAVFALLLGKLSHLFASIAPMALRVSAGCLLATGLAWFFVRLRS